MGSAASCLTEHRTEALRNHATALLYRYVLFPGARVYWRLFKPETYGVRILLRNRENGNILLVRHVYGRRELWFPPGGGYRPDTEAAADAIRRETWEEVGLEAEDIVLIGEAQDNDYGNLDTVHYFSGFVNQTQVTPSAEIADFRWVALEDCINLGALSRHTQRSLRFVQGVDQSA